MIIIDSLPCADCNKAVLTKPLELLLTDNMLRHDVLLSLSSQHVSSMPGLTSSRLDWLLFKDLEWIIDV